MKTLTADQQQAIHSLETTPPDELFVFLWQGNETLPGVRTLMKKYPEAQKRVNAHVWTKYQIPTMEGLRSSGSRTKEEKIATLKEVLVALIRYDLMEPPGAEQDEHGKWDCFLVGNVPKAQTLATPATPTPPPPPQKPIAASAEVIDVSPKAPAPAAVYISEPTPVATLGTAAQIILANLKAKAKAAPDAAHEQRIKHIEDLCAGYENSIAVLQAEVAELKQFITQLAEGLK